VARLCRPSANQPHGPCQGHTRSCGTDSTYFLIFVFSPFQERNSDRRSVFNFVFSHTFQSLKPIIFYCKIMFPYLKTTYSNSVIITYFPKTLKTTFHSKLNSLPNNPTPETYSLKHKLHSI